MRFLSLGFCVGLFCATVVSCGPMPSKKACSAATCAGCCAESGECLAGSAVFECGQGGAACVACASNEVCAEGACALFSAGNYDASFPDLPMPMLHLDAGVYRPPDSGVVVVDAGTVDAGPANVSYSAQIQPIFDSRCDACHQWNYDSIVGVNARITPGILNASAIYTRTLAGDMPRGGGAPLTVSQQLLLRDWILNGAPRN